MDEFELEIKKSLETENKGVRAPDELERRVVRSTLFADVVRSLIVFYVGAFAGVWRRVLGSRGKTPRGGGRQ